MKREGDHLLQIARGQRIRGDGTHQDLVMTVEIRVDPQTKEVRVGDRLDERWSPAL